MKKLKLIPGLMLLALCVAVLGVGIYAAAPASNTITGTVSVTAANAEVEVSVYEDYYNSASPATNRKSTGTTRTGLDLSMGSFTFDASSANTKYDVPLKEIIIVVKNHSTQDLGMYFWKTSNEGGDSTLNVIASGTEAGCVQVSDVLYGHYKYASTSAVANVVDVEYEFYKHLPKAVDANTNGTIEASEYGTETIRMYVRLDKLVEDDVTVNLNVNLNIEKYVSNWSSSQTGFVKVGPDQLTGNPKRDMPTTYSSGLTHLTLPYNTRTFKSRGDEDSYLKNTNLCAIGLPGTLTYIANSSLFIGEGSGNWSNFNSLILPDSITDLDDWSTTITSIVIPKNVNIISNCRGLSEWVSVNPNNQTYESPNGCNAIITRTYVPLGDGNYSAHTLIVGNNNTVIPSTATIIGTSAFAACTGLTSITIPSSITIIEWSAFGGCTGLTSVTFKTTTGWRVADYEDMTGATTLSASNLENPSTAATYLKTTYRYKYWARSN